MTAMPNFSDDDPRPWPEPLPLRAPLDEAGPYPVEALPDVFRAAVADVEAATQAPIALIANSALAAASLAGQHVCDVVRDGALRGPLSLALVAIAASGERKSAVDQFFAHPLREWERQRCAELAPDVQRARVAMTAWTAERDGIVAGLKAAATKGNDAAAFQPRLEAHEARRPSPVRQPRVFYADASTEKLVAAMAADDGWPSVASWSAEGGTIVGGWAFGDDSRLRSVATLNALWSGEPLHVDRVGRGTVRAEGQRLTINWAMQPGVFANFRRSGRGIARASGLFARCLLVEPRSRMGLRQYRSAPTSTPGLDRFASHLTSLLNHSLPLDDRGRLCPPPIPLSAGALSEWIKLHDAIECALAEGRELRAVCDWAAKAPEQVARIAALFELVERSSVPAEISADSVARAATLVLWYAREALRLLGAGETPVSDAQLLEDWLTHHGGQLPRRDIQNGAPKPLRDGKRLAAAIEVLEACGRARVATIGKSRIVELNPALFGGLT